MGFFQMGHVGFPARKHMDAIVQTVVEVTNIGSSGTILWTCRYVENIAMSFGGMATEISSLREYPAILRAAVFRATIHEVAGV